VFVERVRRARSSALTQVAVSQQDGFVMEIMTVHGDMSDEQNCGGVFMT